MKIGKKDFKLKEKAVKEFKDHFEENLIKGASFSVGGDRRTFFSILKEKGRIIVPIIVRFDPIEEKEYPFFNPPPLVQAIEKWGLDGVVLGTDEYIFHGNNSFISLGKQITNKIPFIRMDLFVDPVQVYESLAIGADGIYLNKENLWRKNIWEIIEEALGAALDVIIENPDMKFLQKFLQKFPENAKDIFLIWDHELFQQMENEMKKLKNYIDEHNFISFLLLRKQEIIQSNILNEWNIRGVFYYPAQSNSMDTYIEFSKKIKNQYV